MSAYVVDNDTINKILSFIKLNYGTFSRILKPFEELGYDPIDNPQDFGNDILALNQDAVMQRYPDCDATNLPGPIDPEPYEFCLVFVDPIQAYKSLGCLIYQCSEGDVIDTALYKALRMARDLLSHAVVGLSEAYHAAYWG